MRTSTNNRRVADPVDQLRDDIAAFRKDLMAVLGGGLSSAGSKMRNLADETKKHAEDAHKSIAHVAGTRPLTTIASALAAGFVLAHVLRWTGRE